jgi:GR25 family glycosyltransferase involved in LPS biosynthesis
MVDHAYCINLERRPDRREQAEAEFETLAFDVEFWPATDGKQGAPQGIRITESEWGCADSHIRIWKDIVEQNYSVALVFEDDVRILPQFSEKLEQVLAEAPPNWDIINLGTMDGRDRGERVSPLLREGATYGTHCYLISNRGARKMAFWDAADLRYGIDSQIARSPYKLYYADVPLANQMSTTSSVLGGYESWIQGDIGFNRTKDWDFILRDTIQKTDWFLVFTSAVLIFVIFSRS